MKIYARKKGVSVPYNFSHGGTNDIYDGDTLIGEAIARGYHIVPSMQAYPQAEWDNNIFVMTPDPPYSDEEKNRAKRTMEELAFTITRYEFLNFFWWIFKIISTNGLWIGPTSLKNKRAYCFETVAVIANAARQGSFPEDYATCGVDIYASGHYKPKDQV